MCVRAKRGRKEGRVGEKRGLNLDIETGTSRLSPTQYTGLILCLVPTLQKKCLVLVHQLHETALTHFNGIVNKS